MLIKTAWAALLLGTAALASAQPYPSRPIRVIVNFSGGGNVDNIARLITPKLEAQMGTNFVIDNRGGANGIIGAEIASRAAPDGYTLLFSPSSVAVNQVTFSRLPYNVLKDFAPITNACSGTGYLLLVHPSVPARTVKELIALSKEKSLTYGTPGQGNPQHYMGEYFNMRTGARMIHVPYKGVAPQVIGALSGEVGVIFAPPLAVQQHVASGKLHAIAFSGEKRWSAMPELATISESGVPGFVWRTGWQGWFAPARTPDEIVARLNAEIRKALNDPKVRATLVAGGYDIIADTPAEFSAFIKSEIARYSQIARSAGIRLD